MLIKKKDLYVKQTKNVSQTCLISLTNLLWCF